MHVAGCGLKICLAANAVDMDGLHKRYRHQAGVGGRPLTMPVFICLQYCIYGALHCQEYAAMESSCWQMDEGFSPSV